jgi:Sec-independent protein translocase protein TatA
MSRKSASSSLKARTKMEIFGVGIPEMMFIVLIALILLGPKDMIAAGRTMGSLLRKLLTSPTWQAMRRTGEELQQLPTKLVREAGLEDLQSEVQGMNQMLKPPDLKKIFDERQIFNPNPQPANPAKDEAPASSPDPVNTSPTEPKPLAPSSPDE